MFPGGGRHILDLDLSPVPVLVLAIWTPDWEDDGAMTVALTGLKIPKHIAIIMDGNGRWAREQGLQRILGHESGAETVREITRECSRLGVERLTLYAFSAENWKRPEREVDFLMHLLSEYLVKERQEIMDNNIRFTAIGRLHELPEAVRLELAGTSQMKGGARGLPWIDGL